MKYLRKCYGFVSWISQSYSDVRNGDTVWPRKWGSFLLHDRHCEWSREPTAWFQNATPTPLDSSNLLREFSGGRQTVKITSWNEKKISWSWKFVQTNATFTQTKQCSYGTSWNPANALIPGSVTDSTYATGYSHPMRDGIYGGRWQVDSHVMCGHTVGLRVRVKSRLVPFVPLHSGMPLPLLVDF
jgi:hypothetical protein